MKNIFPFFILISTLLLFGCQSGQTKKDSPPTSKLKALIVDGENNHGVWPKTTMMMKDFLEQTGLFEVDIARTAFTWQGPHYDASIGMENIKDLLTMYPLNTDTKTTSVEDPVPDPNYNPDFEKYDVVISNMGWKASPWPAATKASFEKYMAEGGGLVVIHAADNAWSDWPAYNKMIGIGGWGGRDSTSGTHLYYNDSGTLLHDIPEGNCGFHGPQHEYVLETKAPDHPIMKGLPTKWLHNTDELYGRLCGPAENVTVLATANSGSEKNNPTDGEKMEYIGRHEPMLLAINYGKGRVFHTSMGHMDYSMECVGFMTTFQRGTEWATTGKVTQAVPKDFPSVSAVSLRKWEGLNSE